MRSPLVWWAMNPQSAFDRQHELAPQWEGEKDECEHVVALIDEIDKTDSDVPNGLLEILGQRRFTPMGYSRPVLANRSPLVIISTNEEQSLPDAFVRRCFVLHLKVPKKEEKFIAFMEERGRAHFGDTFEKDEYGLAAKQLFQDRSAAEKEGFPPPGLAEYLDLLRAVKELRGESSAKDLLDALAKYAYRKHRSDLG